MNTYKKQLFLLKQGDKFIHENKTYTVYTHEGNMTEVFDGTRFYAWPTWNGKGPTIVNYLKSHESNEKQHIGTSIREAA